MLSFSWPVFPFFRFPRVYWEWCTQLVIPGTLTAAGEDKGAGWVLSATAIAEKWGAILPNLDPNLCAGEYRGDFSIS